MSLMLFLLLLMLLFLVRFLWPLFRVGFGIYRQVRSFQKNQPQSPDTNAPPKASRPVKGEYIEFEDLR